MGMSDTALNLLHAKSKFAQLKHFVVGGICAIYRDPHCIERTA
jgi:hypothetical protein